MREMALYVLMMWNKCVVAPSMVLVGNINIDDSSLPLWLEKKKEEDVWVVLLSTISPYHTGRETRMEMNENEQVDTTPQSGANPLYPRLVPKSNALHYPPSTA